MGEEQLGARVLRTSKQNLLAPLFRLTRLWLPAVPHSPNWRRTPEESLFFWVPHLAHSARWALVARGGIDFAVAAPGDFRSLRPQCTSTRTLLRPFGVTFTASPPPSHFCKTDGSAHSSSQPF